MAVLSAFLLVMPAGLHVDSRHRFCLTPPLAPVFHLGFMQAEYGLLPFSGTPRPTRRRHSSGAGVACF